MGRPGLKRGSGLQAPKTCTFGGENKGEGKKRWEETENEKETENAGHRTRIRPYKERRYRDTETDGGGETQRTKRQGGRKTETEIHRETETQIRETERKHTEGGRAERHQAGEDGCAEMGSSAGQGVSEEAGACWEELGWLRAAWTVGGSKDVGEQLGPGEWVSKRQVYEQGDGTRPMAGVGGRTRGWGAGGLLGRGETKGAKVTGRTGASVEEAGHLRGREGREGHLDD